MNAELVEARISISLKAAQRRFPRTTHSISLRYVVLDTELTSLDYRTNRLLSIGAISMQGPSIQLGNQFYRVINPGRIDSRGERRHSQASGGRRCGRRTAREVSR